MSRRAPLCMLLCCLLLAGCAMHHGRGMQTSAEGVPALQKLSLPTGASMYLEVTSSAGHDVSGDLHSLLTALLQSDKGLHIADSAAQADVQVQVHVLQANRTSSSAVGMSLSQAAGPALVGTLGGAMVGGAVGGRSGAAWGAGAGLLLGLGLGWAENSDNTKDVWALIADVTILRKKSGKNIQETKSRIAVAGDGVNLNREAALSALEDRLAQEIVNVFTLEGT